MAECFRVSVTSSTQVIYGKSAITHAPYRCSCRCPSVAAKLVHCQRFKRSYSTTLLLSPSAPPALITLLLTSANLTLTSLSPLVITIPLNYIAPQRLTSQQYLPTSTSLDTSRMTPPLMLDANGNPDPAPRGLLIAM